MIKKFEHIVLVDGNNNPLPEDKQYFEDNEQLSELRKQAKASGEAFKKALSDGFLDN